ncbi:hypothetical protein BU17DRAFT_69428 [Hysterangium stoloniferum]|nr:hypothetical protein BU17DRAFT_69428 [Hysterangium stoloniferum]
MAFRACTVATSPDIHVVYSTKLLHIGWYLQNLVRDIPINDVALPLNKYLAWGLQPVQTTPPHELRINSQSTHSQVKIAPSQRPSSQGQRPSSQVHVAQRAARAFWGTTSPVYGSKWEVVVRMKGVTKAERGDMRELKALAHLTMIATFYGRHYRTIVGHL